MSNLTIPKIALLCFIMLGCAEPQSAGVPPVLDAIGDMQQAADHRDAAAEVQRQTAIEENRASKPPQEGKYVVEFDTTAGKFSIEVNREWAPIGADRFYKLVKDDFFDGAGFFRVVPQFMVQWGLAADPEKTRKWSGPILDEPVRVSNTRGYITFAKSSMPNSRSSQVFINFANNARLDADGFAPFGKVIKGMETVDGISSVHRESPDQNMVRTGGSAYLKQNFPKLDYINTATFVLDDLAEESATESPDETPSKEAAEE